MYFIAGQETVVRESELHSDLGARTRIMLLLMIKLRRLHQLNQNGETVYTVV